MAKQSYALEAGGPKRLEIAWKGMYKNATVSVDGQLVGTIPDQKALVKGQEFRLPDGSAIQVQLVTKLYGTELRVLRNGQPLPGSASDPNSRLKNAYLMVYFVAGLNLVLGLVALLFNVAILQEIGLGVGSILFGLIFLGLGFFVQRRSLLALIVAIVLFAIDGLAGLVLAAGQGYNPGGATVARIIRLIPMIQGVGAIQDLKKKVVASGLQAP